MILLYYMRYNYNTRVMPSADEDEAVTIAKCADTHIP